MSKWSSIAKHLAIATAIASAGGRAWAQTTYVLNGSDTLENIMIDSINRATSKPGWPSGVALRYIGGGSSTGESAVVANQQSIAAMSRNLKSSVVGTTLGSKPFELNGPNNVVALDAAVFVTYNGKIGNINLPTFADTVDTTNKAFPNKWGVCSTATSTRCAANTDCPTGQTCVWSDAATYDQIMEVVMSGVDGSGSTKACAHPARIAAIYQLGTWQGTGTGWMDRFYRRDDNSGTTDTFKDKIAVKNFCNGRARGVLATFSTTNANLNNQDIDPIRRPCPAPESLPGGALRPATSCTNVSTGTSCVASDNAADCNPTLPYVPGFPGPTSENGCPCTQGWVVALSRGDNQVPGDLLDVTRTISSRVSADLNGQTMGFAGREAVRIPAYNSTGPAISRFPFSDASVRGDDYLLSRRLFVGRASINTDAVANATINPGTGFPWEPAAGLAAKKGAEDFLFTFMTDDGTTSPDGSIGACNIQDIVKTHGFLTCMPDPCSDNNPPPNNLCGKGFPFAASSVAALIPNSSSGPRPWDYGEVSCSAGQFCATDNSLCPASGKCPTGHGFRAAGYACSMTRECQAGLTCRDDGNGIGVLTCQP